jgi:molecular chaperone GrpE
MNTENSKDKAENSTEEVEAQQPQSVAEVDNSQETILALEEQVKELKNQVLRGLAETENVRKRAAKEMAEYQKYSISKLTESLINVLENLYRSTEHLSEESLQNEVIKKISEGIEITRKEFLNILEKNGVKRILPKIGDKFDHNFHQALSQQASLDYPSDTIIHVVQAGYVLNERLLKPAMVIVSKSE